MKSIIFLHGGGLNKAMWLPQTTVLKKDFDVHMIDLPGHGNKINEEFTINAAIEDINNYITHKTNKAVILVGISLGGYVGMAYTEQYPAKVLKLVLSGCSVQYSGYMNLLAKVSILGSYFISENAFTLMQRKLLIKITNYETVSDICKNKISKKSAIQSFKNIINKDFLLILSRIKIPVLLINGEDDYLNVKNEFLYIEANNNIVVKRIDNAGHLCNLQKPEQFTNLLCEFVK